MQSARLICGAGRTLTGMSTIPASPTHSVSAPVTAGLRLSQTRQPFASRPGAGCSPAVSRAATSTNRSRPDHAFAISNRHMMQLEIAVSPAEPTRSLFLIVTKPRLCSQPFLHFPLATPVVRGTRREYTRENMDVIVATSQFQIGKLPA